MNSWPNWLLSQWGGICLMRTPGAYRRRGLSVKSKWTSDVEGTLLRVCGFFKGEKSFTWERTKIFLGGKLGRKKNLNVLSLVLFSSRISSARPIMGKREIGIAFSIGSVCMPFSALKSNEHPAPPRERRILNAMWIKNLHGKYSVQQVLIWGPTLGGLHAVAKASFLVVIPHPN